MDIAERLVAVVDEKSKDKFAKNEKKLKHIAEKIGICEKNDDVKTIIEKIRKNLT